MVMARLANPPVRTNSGAALVFISVAAPVPALPLLTYRVPSDPEGTPPSRGATWSSFRSAAAQSRASSSVRLTGLRLRT